MQKSRTRLSVVASVTAAGMLLATPAIAAQGAGGVAGAGAPLSGRRAIVQRLADPAATAIGVATANLGSAMSPDEDLADALAGLAAAPDAAAVTKWRKLALDVLEGNPIAGKAYSGIPLLSFNTPGKVKTVPAGGSVTVREIRFGDRAISDTAALRFDNPALPFTIVYRVSELGGTMGGLLTPVPLSPAGTASPATTEFLAVPELATGTTEANQFHTAGAPEQTRLVVQDVTVPMPAPNAVAAILDPSMRPGRPSLSTLMPATPERIAALDAFGGDKAAAIARLADVAPAKQLWSDLARLGVTDVAGAHTIGAADAGLLAGIRTHIGLPGGLDAHGLSLALAGNEAFTSRRSMPLAAGGSVPVEVANLDGAPHMVTAAALTGGTRGADYNWGSFAWQSLGAPVAVAPTTTIAITVPVPAGTFALWLGDADSGDQASVLVMDGPVVTATPAPVPPAPVPVATPPAPPVTNAGKPAAAPAPVAQAPAPAAPAVKAATKPAVKAKVVRARAVRSTRRVVRSVRRLAKRVARVVVPVSKPARESVKRIQRF